MMGRKDDSGAWGFTKDQLAFLLICGNFCGIDKVKTRNREAA
jgi:hypothetical protein